jgi:hypothetical protein
VVTGVVDVVDGDGVVDVEIFGGSVVGETVGCDVPQPTVPTAMTASVIAVTTRYPDHDDPVVVRSSTSTAASFV